MSNDHQFYNSNRINKLSTQIPLLMNEYHIPGLALAIATGDKITTLEFGVKNSISCEPIVASTVFEGASLSKPVIAYAALKLCEQGSLSLDQPLASYLGDFELPDDPRVSSVTLRQVLSHTSGFPTMNLKKGDSLKLEFEPGLQFGYSGESFRYLGRVIEKISGTSLSIYMQEHVFRPLIMNDSSFIWEDKYETMSASPHDRKGQPTDKWKPIQAVASFSLHTTPSDFAKFMIAICQFPEMLEVNSKINDSLGWSLGWGIETTPEGIGFWHSGDNGTFQCFAFQRKEKGFVLMCNSANGFKICEAVLSNVIGGHHPLIEWEQFNTRDDESIDDDFLANWWKNYD